MIFGHEFSIILLFQMDFFVRLLLILQKELIKKQVLQLCMKHINTAEVIVPVGTIDVGEQVRKNFCND